MTPAQSWPRHVFETPVLRGIDERGREAIEAAGELREVSSGTTVYEADTRGDAFFIVASGAVELSAVRRGDDRSSVVRVARRGESFAEEVTLSGGTHRLTARAEETSQLAVVPVAVYQRAAGRSGAAAAERERRVLVRAATRDLLHTLAFTRELSRDDLDIVLDALVPEEVARGERIYAPGDAADAFYLIHDGLVQLTREDAGELQVQAYLSRGDFFGDVELVAGTPRQLGAVALGPCSLLQLPADVLRSLADRNPGLLKRLRRIATQKESEQADVVGRAEARSTQHAFRDLYRMQMARSMLAIDLDSCVRCGHCAWACESVHGVARLVRRGDKIVTRLALVDEQPEPPKASSLLLPNSCQHCKNPSCMLDCPTGAIGRDPGGEVFIREELCTGCGACAKACPWENIQMAPRLKLHGQPEPDSSRSSGARPLSALYPEVAVKCDLCRDYEESACVTACPTQAIFRLDPGREVDEVQALLGLAPDAADDRGKASGRVQGRQWERWVLSAAAAGALGAGLVAQRLHEVGALAPGRGWGLVGGWVAALLCLALASYVGVKRRFGVFSQRRSRESAARQAASRLSGEGRETPRNRSRVRPHRIIHIALGLVLVAGVLLHAGPRLSASSGGLLAATLWCSVALGFLGALAQWLLPRRLTRLERSGALPEDLRAQQQRLEDRLFREASGRSDLVKKLLERLLLPYARRRLGFLLLLVGGNSLTTERARLRARVDAMLQGRGAERLAGLDDLIKVVVDLRALPARRVMSALLRWWHLPHLLLTGAVIALLVLHVVGGVR